MKGNGLRLSGVLIDFGETLAHLDKNANRRYERNLHTLLRKKGYPKELNQVSTALLASLGGSTKGEFLTIHEFWRDFLRNLQIDQMSREFIEELEEVRSHHSATIFKLYDGVPKVLSDLQGKCQLALVSNCAIGTADVIDALGIRDYFEAVILSYEVGVRKPEKRIYLEALAQLELEPHVCIFVADEISDLEGARNVGLKTVLVRQGYLTTLNAKDQHFQPDFECGHIAELARFLN